MGVYAGIMTHLRTKLWVFHTQWMSWGVWKTPTFDDYLDKFGCINHHVIFFSRFAQFCQNYLQRWPLANTFFTFLTRQKTWKFIWVKGGFWLHGIISHSSHPIPLHPTQSHHWCFDVESYCIYFWYRNNNEPRKLPGVDGRGLGWPGWELGPIPFQSHSNPTPISPGPIVQNCPQCLRIWGHEHNFVSDHILHFSEYLRVQLG